MTERERLIELLDDRTRPWYYLLGTANNIRLLADYLLENNVKPLPFKIDDIVYYVKETGEDHSLKIEPAFVIMLSQKKDKTWKVRISFGNGGTRYNTAEIAERDIGAVLFRSFDEATEYVKNKKG